MPKVLLLDADGVVLKKREYFSERFAREQGILVEEMQEFFKNEFKLCQTGKADLKEALKEKLAGWGWEKSVDEFLEYWFTNDVELDEEVLLLVQDLRARGVMCFLSTDQEKYRKAYIQQLLDGQLDGYFISCDVGFTKSTPEFFQQILETLNVPASEVSYLDDDQKNVDAAKSLGINAKFYSNIEDLKSI